MVGRVPAAFLQHLLLLPRQHPEAPLRGTTPFTQVTGGRAQAAGTARIQASKHTQPQSHCCCCWVAAQPASLIAVPLALVQYRWFICCEHYQRLGGRKAGPWAWYSPAGLAGTAQPRWAAARVYATVPYTHR